MTNRALAFALVFCAACGPLPVDEVDETAEGEVVTSIFRDRNLKRATLQNQSAAQNVIDVHDENEFRAALTALPLLSGDCYGRSIRFVVPEVVLSDGFTLGVQHAGLAITSSSTTSLSFLDSPSSVFFTVPSGVDDVHISGIEWPASTTLVAIAANRLVVRDVVSQSTGTLLVVGNAEVAADLVVNGARTSGALLSSGGSGIFTQTSITQSIGGACIASVLNSSFNGNVFTGFVQLTGDTNLVVGNRIGGNLTLVGSNNAVSSNHLGGNNIDTTSGGGGNSIVGNTSVGAISFAAGDAVGLNT